MRCHGHTVRRGTHRRNTRHSTPASRKLDRSARRISDRDLSLPPADAISRTRLHTLEVDMATELRWECDVDSRRVSQRDGYRGCRGGRGSGSRGVK